MPKLARFSAFAVGDASYLLLTCHEATRPAALELDAGLERRRLERRLSRDRRSRRTVPRRRGSGSDSGAQVLDAAAERRVFDLGDEDRGGVQSVLIAEVRAQEVCPDR